MAFINPACKLQLYSPRFLRPNNDLSTTATLIHFIGTRTLENHTAVPLEDILWLHDLMNEYKDHLLPFEDSLRLLRRKLFPFSHDPYPFVAGKMFRTA
jgi:hypothetical protein